MKEKAVWHDCPCGEAEGDHMQRDNCLACAPWWWEVPYCPKCRAKLATSGWCKECRKFRDVTRPIAELLGVEDVYINSPDNPIKLKVTFIHKKGCDEKCGNNCIIEKEVG